MQLSQAINLINWWGVWSSLWYGLGHVGMHAIANFFFFFCFKKLFLPLADGFEVSVEPNQLGVFGLGGPVLASTG